MGCDIHSVAQKRDENGDWARALEDEVFGDRNYGAFGFLANVRNYSAVTPIAEPRGLPTDFDEDKHASGYIGDHSFSYLSVEELRAVNYDQIIEDRRVTRQTSPNTFDGGCTAEPGGGESITLREFLGTGFMNDLERLYESGAERVVFGFDS